MSAPRCLDCKAFLVVDEHMAGLCRSCVHDAAAERDALRAQLADARLVMESAGYGGVIPSPDALDLAAMRAERRVVEAAVAWRDTWRHRKPFGDEQLAVALVDAVDALEGRP